MSPARAKQYAVYLKKRRAYLTEHRMCETHPLIYPGENVPVARDIHHTAGRTGELLNDETKWKSCCRNCHHWIGSFVKRARELGLIAPAGRWNSTAKTNNPRRIEQA